jgi:hypothetical protein
MRQLVRLVTAYGPHHRQPKPAALQSEAMDGPPASLRDDRLDLVTLSAMARTFAIRSAGRTAGSSGRRPPSWSGWPMRHALALRRT